MISFRHLSLRSKILLFLTGVTLIALVLACSAFVLLDQATRRVDARVELEREAQKLANQARVILDFGEPSEMDGVFKMFFENPRLISGAVYRADGGLFRSYSRLMAVIPIPDSVPGSEWVVQGDYFSSVVPVQAGGKSFGTVLLIRDQVDVRQRAREFVGVAAAVLGMSFVVALLLSLRLRKYLIGPLLELSRAATGVARSNDYAVRVSRHSNDEIGQLVDDFNEMLAQIESRDARLSEAHDTLEQKVAERTIELSAANTKLRAEIASREEAETALDRSRKKLLLHVRQTPMGVIDWNLQAQAMSWNPAAEKIFGWKESEVVGRNWRDFLVGSDEIGRVDRMWSEVAERREGVQSIQHNRTSDGRVIICEWFNTRLVDEGGRIVGVASMVQDISRRVMSETELRESEERFAKAFQASPSAIGILSVEEGRFLDANGNFVNLLGRSREEVLGATDLELGLWTEPSDRDRLFWNVRRQRALRDFECRLNAREGSVRTTLISAESVTLGSSKCVLLQVHDITQRLDLETQLRQSQKMDAIGQLAAGVAHDFNNILTIIQGHSALLSAVASRDADEAESVAEIAAAAGRAAKLTRQLLAFSRKQVMRAQVVDLNEIVTESAKMLQRLVGETIEIQIEASPTKALANVDSGMIEQIILNLAVNSRDAMPSGGTLRVSVGRVLVDQEEVELNPESAAGAFVSLSVQDTGHGMDAATRARAFEPFFTTKEVGMGTGLGLATVYGIVRQHRGWIELDSEPDRGTTFRIYLPEAGVEAMSEDGGKKESGRRVADGHETILVVEDEPALRRMLSRTLRRHGYRVYEAEHGPEAVEIWRERADEIELMVTDMVMPGGINGRDLAKKFQTDRPSLKVIYTSGYSPELLVEGNGLPEDACFIAKPYAIAELAGVLRRELDGPGDDFTPRS